MSPANDEDQDHHIRRIAEGIIDKRVSTVQWWIIGLLVSNILSVTAGFGTLVHKFDALDASQDEIQRQQSIDEATAKEHRSQRDVQLDQMARDNDALVTAERKNLEAEITSERDDRLRTNREIYAAMHQGAADRFTGRMAKDLEDEHRTKDRMFPWVDVGDLQRREIDLAQ